MLYLQSHNYVQIYITLSYYVWAIRNIYTGIFTNKPWHGIGRNTYTHHTKNSTSTSFKLTLFLKTNTETEKLLSQLFVRVKKTIHFLLFYKIYFLFWQGYKWQKYLPDMSTNAAASQGNYQVKNAAQITLFNIVSVSRSK